MEAFHKIKLKKYNIIGLFSKMLPHDESQTYMYFCLDKQNLLEFFFNNDMVGGFELTEFLLD